MSAPTERESVVTGGTAGIGRAVALRLARGGDRVIVVGHSEVRGALSGLCWGLARARHIPLAQ